MILPYFFALVPFWWNVNHFYYLFRVVFRYYLNSGYTIVKFMVATVTHNRAILAQFESQNIMGNSNLATEDPRWM